MMQMRDWITGLIGTLLLVFGLLPLLGILSFLNDIPSKVLVWVVLFFGLFLLYCSIVEITNSNIIGWVSFFVAGILILTVLLPLLSTLGIGPSWFGYSLPRSMFNVIFIIQGAFLMAATFAMEL